MNLEFAHIRENIADCDARIAANRAWSAHIDRLTERRGQFEVTRGLEIQPVHETSPDTPQGLLKVATDGERNGRLAWVPGC
jgi:N-methylhydantoinase B/oxoprolinase/acetone carboxylase alpha subunit